MINQIKNFIHQRKLTRQYKLECLVITGVCAANIDYHDFDRSSAKWEKYLDDRVNDLKIELMIQGWEKFND